MTPTSDGTDMRAAVYHGAGDVRVESIPRPLSAGPGELLIRVGTVGVCGSDAAEWRSGPVQVPLTTPHPVTGHLGPLVLGHEFSGTVVAAGEGVGAEWIGATIACAGSAPCGTCAQCTAGRSSQCRNYYVVGLHQNGALAEYVVAPARSCIVVDPAELSTDEAALAQPMAIAVHAVRRSSIAAGENAVVIGIGGIGAFLVHALVQLGVSVTAVDLDDGRLEVARALGAESTLLATANLAGSDIVDAHGAAPQVIFEVSGASSALRAALAAASVGGTIVLVGMHKHPTDVVFADVALREQTIVGTNGLSPRDDLPAAVELLRARAGRWGMIAPTVLPLDQLAGSLALIAAGRSPAIKVLIDPSALVARPPAIARSGRVRHPHSPPQPR